MGYDGNPPKSWERQLALYAAGAAIKSADPDLSDVIFLDAHPGWSWADLMAAPDPIIGGLRLLDRKKGQRKP